MTVLRINPDGIVLADDGNVVCLGFVPVLSIQPVLRDAQCSLVTVFAEGRYACFQSQIEKGVIFIVPLDCPPRTKRRSECAQTSYGFNGKAGLFRFLSVLPLTLVERQPGLKYSVLPIETVFDCVGFMTELSLMKVAVLAKRSDENFCRLFGFEVVIHEPRQAFSGGPPIPPAWSIPLIVDRDCRLLRRPSNSSGNKIDQIMVASPSCLLVFQWSTAATLHPHQDMPLPVRLSQRVIVVPGGKLVIENIKYPPSDEIQETSDKRVYLFTSENFGAESATLFAHDYEKFRQQCYRQLTQNWTLEAPLEILNEQCPFFEGDAPKLPDNKVVTYQKSIHCGNRVCQVAVRTLSTCSQLLPSMKLPRKLTTTEFQIQIDSAFHTVFWTTDGLVCGQTRAHDRKLELVLSFLRLSESGARFSENTRSRSYSMVSPKGESRPSVPAVENKRELRNFAKPIFVPLSVSETLFILPDTATQGAERNSVVKYFDTRRILRPERIFKTGVKTQSMRHIIVPRHAGAAGWTSVLESDSGMLILRIAESTRETRQIKNKGKVLGACLTASTSCPGLILLVDTGSILMIHDIHDSTCLTYVPAKGSAPFLPSPIPWMDSSVSADRSTGQIVFENAGGLSVIEYTMSQNRYECRTSRLYDNTAIVVSGGWTTTGTIVRLSVTLLQDDHTMCVLIRQFELSDEAKSVELIEVSSNQQKYESEFRVVDVAISRISGTSDQWTLVAVTSACCVHVYSIECRPPFNHIMHAEVGLTFAITTVPPRLLPGRCFIIKSDEDNFYRVLQTNPLRWLLFYTGDQMNPLAVDTTSDSELQVLALHAVSQTLVVMGHKLKQNHFTFSKQISIPSTEFIAGSFDASNAVHLVGVSSPSGRAKASVLVSMGIPCFQLRCALPISVLNSEQNSMQTSWDRPLAIDAVSLENSDGRSLIAISTQRQLVVQRASPPGFGRCLVFEYKDIPWKQSFPIDLSSLVYFVPIPPTVVEGGHKTLDHLCLGEDSVDRLESGEALEPLCWKRMEQEDFVFVRRWKCQTTACLWLPARCLSSRPSLSYSSSADLGSPTQALHRMFSGLWNTSPASAALVDQLIKKGLPEANRYFYEIRAEIQLEQASESLRWVVPRGGSPHLVVSNGLFFSVFVYAEREMRPLFTSPQTSIASRILPASHPQPRRGFPHLLVQSQTEALVLYDLITEGTPALRCLGHSSSPKGNWQAVEEIVPLGEVDRELEGFLAFQWTDKRELAIWCCDSMRELPLKDIYLVSTWQPLAFTGLKQAPCLQWKASTSILTVRDRESGLLLGAVWLRRLGETRTVCGLWSDMYLWGLGDKAAFAEISLHTMGRLLDLEMVLRFLEASLLLNLDDAYCVSENEPASKQRRTEAPGGRESDIDWNTGKSKCELLAHSAESDAAVTLCDSPTHCVDTSSSCDSEDPLDVRGLDLESELPSSALESSSQVVEHKHGAAYQRSSFAVYLRTWWSQRGTDGQGALMLKQLMVQEFESLKSVLAQSLSILRAYRFFTDMSVAYVSVRSPMLRRVFFDSLKSLLDEDRISAMTCHAIKDILMRDEALCSKLLQSELIYKLPTPLVDAMWLRRCTEVALRSTLDIREFTQSLAIQFCSASPLIAETQIEEQPELTSAAKTKLHIVDLEFLLSALKQSDDDDIERLLGWFPYDASWDKETAVVACTNICAQILYRIHSEAN